MVSSIILGTATAVRSFQTLSTTLNSPDAKLSHLIDSEALSDEFGRFRVWSGNLGALQKGHSSLDYRLRDSPLLASNALKLLTELKDNLVEANVVVSGIRLPYEQQTKSAPTEADEEEDDSFFSDDEDDDSAEGAPKTELEQRFREVVDIIDNLYKLSVRIRQPTLRTRSLKAASYRPKDPESGVDIFEQYAKLDLQHTQALVKHLRVPHTDEELPGHDVLVERLSAAITLRRRQFRYWRRHRDKLGVSILPEEELQDLSPAVQRPDAPARHDTLEAQRASIPVVTALKEAASQKTGKTLLSGTEATHYHQTLDDIVDSESVTSYATTVRDLTGKGIELPPPPKAADGDKDFECPYCFIICPARYGKGRPWRTHVLQDLQPYICTYPDCDGPEQLFRSRREWSEHEATHRKAWRCLEHPTAVYRLRTGLEQHLRHEHMDSFPGYQLNSIINVGETSTVDTREKCPICYAEAETEGMGGLQNHVANHLERFAAFSLPSAAADDETDGASSVASRGGSASTGSSQYLSQNFSENSLFSEDTHETRQNINDGPSISPEISGSAQHAEGRQSEELSPAQRLLSAEALGTLPDSSQKRLDILLSGKPDPDTNEETFDESTAEQEPFHSSAVVDDDSTSSMSLSYDDNDNEGRPQILRAPDIPTLRSLYRSSQLLRRDQSYAPNDAYNQMVSFCFHDITRLRVDCIVNSANRAMKITRSNDSLNHLIHKAAGPGMRRELRALGRVKEGAVRLTAGYNLPCEYVIHAARPQYAEPKGMTIFNILTECYRNALKTAMDHDIKTIAFPCLGAGGCGFPSRAAARIALQEVREFLDIHKGYSFERIVFCVFSGTDDRAYKDFLPVFFPPTHGDIENAVVVDQLRDLTSIAGQLQEVYTAVEVIAQDLVPFSEAMPDFFPRSVLGELAAISSALRSLEGLFSGSKGSTTNLSNRAIADIDLICAVLHSACNSVTLIVEQAKHADGPREQKYKAMWDGLNLHMKDKQGMDLQMLLVLCQDFAQSLDDILAHDGTEPYEMATMRVRLASYRVSRTGQNDDDVRDRFDEVLYTREFQRAAKVSSRAGIIKTHQIPSLSRLYQLGELEYRPTYAEPDRRQLYAVCLLREDITRLNVDVIVNSTDMGFSGMGTLDRTIFQKGGLSMQEDCANFGVCKEGDVRVTQGYLLAARHVIHTIPPETYRRNTKDVLRQLYREVLHTATTLKASSIAIPCLGTGMLLYPRRDCASLAMEEVKRFLETMETSSTIEKIIFCVFSSNDEFIYKSLLPVFFPPLDAELKASPTSELGTAAKTPPPPTTGDSPLPRRTLFGSIGEAFRSVRFGKQPVTDTSRPLRLDEEEALINFEKHVKTCPNCNIYKLYEENRDLCSDGYAAAQLVLQFLYMEASQLVYATNLEDGKRVRVEIPPEFTNCWNLLVVVEKSFRDEHRSRPFVSANQPYRTFTEEEQDTMPPGVNIYNAEVTIPLRKNTEKAIASILTWSDQDQRFKDLFPHECSIYVSPGKVTVYEMGEENHDQPPLLSLELGPQMSLVTSTRCDLALKSRVLEESRHRFENTIVFRSGSAAECELLFQRLTHAATMNPNYQGVEQPPKPTQLGQDEQPTHILSSMPVHRELRNAIVMIFSWREVNSTWRKLYPTECIVSIHPGRLDVYEKDAQEQGENLPLISFDISPFMPVSRPGGTDISLRVHHRRERIKAENNILLRSRSSEEAMALYHAINAARNHRSTFMDDRSRIIPSEQQSQGSILSLPSVPSYDPSNPIGSLSLLTQQLRASQTGSELPQTSVSRKRLALAEDMLSFLKTATKPDLGLHIDEVALALQIPIWSATDIATYLSELNLVHITPENSVWTTAEETDHVSKAHDDSLEHSQPGQPSVLYPLKHRIFTHLKALPEDSDGLHVQKIAEALRVSMSDVARATGDLMSQGYIYSTVDGQTWAVNPGYSELNEPKEPATLDLNGKRVLALLKSMPGNSEGLHVQDIAGRLGLDINDVWRIGDSLQSLELIYTTVDDATWLALDTEDQDLTLPEQRPSRQEQSPTGPASLGPGESHLDLSRADLSTINVDDSFTYLDLAPGTEQLPSTTTSTSEPPEPHPLTQSTTLDTSNLHPRPQQPDSTPRLPIAHQPPPESQLNPTSTPATESEAQQQDKDDDSIRYPRPIIRDHTQANPIPLGARWTKIDRRLVNPQALEEANERFEQHEDSVIVTRVVTREEIVRLAEKTRDIRRGKEEVKEFAKVVGEGRGLM